MRNIILLAVLGLSLSACAVVKTDGFYTQQRLSPIKKDQGQLVMFFLEQKGDPWTYLNATFNNEKDCQFARGTYADIYVPAGRTKIVGNGGSSIEINIPEGQRKYIKATLNQLKYNSMTKGSAFGLIGSAVAYSASDYKDEGDFQFEEVSATKAAKFLPSTEKASGCY